MNDKLIKDFDISLILQINNCEPKNPGPMSGQMTGESEIKIENIGKLES